MGSKRVFDPPLPYEEINRVYDFTNRLLKKLSMSHWRIIVMTKPASLDAYADIRPSKNKYQGELRLGTEWMARDLESERIPSLVHEMLHLTHAGITRAVSDQFYEWVGSKAYQDLHEIWTTEIELWIDHMTQVILAIAGDDIASWAAEIWGNDWRDQGRARVD